MEESSKAIEIAIGVIIFIAALTTAITLYSRLNKTINGVLYINEDTSKVIVSDNTSTPDEIVYTPAEIYFMIQDICSVVDDTSETYIKDEYSPYSKNDLKSIVISSDSKEVNYSVNNFVKRMKKISNFKSDFPEGSTIKIQYEFVYKETESLNLANHSISKITFYVSK